MGPEVGLVTVKADWKPGIRDLDSNYLINDIPTRPCSKTPVHQGVWVYYHEHSLLHSPENTQSRKSCTTFAALCILWTISSPFYDSKQCTP